MFLFQGLSEKKLMQKCCVISLQFKKIMNKYYAENYRKYTDYRTFKTYN